MATLSPAPQQYPVYMGKCGERWQKDFPDIVEPDHSFHVTMSNMKENQKRVEDATAAAPARSPNANNRYSLVIVGREFWD